VARDTLSIKMTPPEEFAAVKLEFLTPTPAQMKLDLVTLLRCPTLMDADMVLSQLESAGIPAFIPDEFLMQNIGFNVNTYGYVRVQVSPKDFEEAKELLSGSGKAP
jgi:putative signal transducing protein